ncbi:MAG TPA: amidase [Capillimicrobium sp.]|nr:amidase [Capillimicrobium sp.]
MTDELHALSATAALAAFRARRLSPVELLEALIARADETEPVVGALCHRSFEAALDQARAAERRYAGRGEPPRPLEGIPLAIKDDEPVAGQPWSQGSLVYRDVVADVTSAFAQRAIDAGAIVHARTATPEFAAAMFTHSRLHGVTRNPWNPDVSPGGSSGGAGAALASGVTVLASGSDVLGSIRVPAAANGVVGFKPPHGRVPVLAPWGLDSFAHCGPMARTVADCVLYQNVVAGPDPSDHASLRPKVTLPATPAPVRGLRVALSADLGDWPLDPDVRRNTLAVADVLREQGATVDEVDVRLSRAAVFRAVAIHLRDGFGAAVEAEVRAHPDDVTPYARDFVRWVRETAGTATSLDGLELQAAIHAALAGVLERYDALLCPTLATRGLAAGEDYVGRGIEVDGTTLGSHLEAALTPVFNVLSRCPVLAVPSGIADNGVPTGVQVVGRTFDDETVFRVGAALERPWRAPNFGSRHKCDAAAPHRDSDRPHGSASPRKETSNQ